MMTKEGAPFAICSHRRHEWWERSAVFVIKSLSRAGLAVLLLHMAGLAVTLQAGIKILIARTISVSAVRPFRVGALNGKTSYPFPLTVLDGKSVGDIVTSSTHL